MQRVKLYRSDMRVAIYYQTKTDCASKGSSVLRALDSFDAGQWVSRLPNFDGSTVWNRDACSIQRAQRFRGIKLKSSIEVSKSVVISTLSSKKSNIFFLYRIIYWLRTAKHTRAKTTTGTRKCRVKNRMQLSKGMLE